MLRSSGASLFGQGSRLLKLRFAERSGISEEALLPHRLKSEERLSQTYRYTLECLSPDVHLELKTLLGQPVEIALLLSDGGSRLLTGLVTAAAQNGADGVESRDAIDDWNGTRRIQSGHTQLASYDYQAVATHVGEDAKGIVQVIGAAQHFIYIEGQFFQSAHGASGPVSSSSSGPMGAMTDITRNPNHRKFAEMLGIAGLTDPVVILARLRWSKIDDVLSEAQGAEYRNDLLAVLKNQATIEAMRAIGNPQNALVNPIAQALVNRIEWAINDSGSGRPFHVYIVVPVPPEGTLNTLNIMSQIHLTMHSLVFGERSLVNSVRRVILVHRYRTEKKLSREAAQAQVDALNLRDLADAVGERWKDYLTLLNLRNWETIGGRPVTEQIYVHSKLVIADDRVAVLGSANINDRSQLGDRDSELAAIITDDAKIKIKLDGQNAVDCGKAIHQLRRDLWEKIFGLKSSNRQAASLASVLDQPAAPATWKAIQKVAFGNARAYENSFWYIPRSSPLPDVQTKEKDDPEKDPPPASVWPTWHYASYLDHEKGGHLRYRMPFDPLFWRAPERGDIPNAWGVAKDAARPLAPENVPDEIQGFIIELPTRWTYREDNLMIKTHISAIAQNTMPVLAEATPVGPAVEANT